MTIAASQLNPPPAGLGAVAAAFRARPRLEAAALGLMLVLPLAMFHARAGADILICLIDLLFLAHAARSGQWGWLRAPWVMAAAGFWLWLTLATLLTGEMPPLGQAVVTVRLFLLVAAAQFWVLRAPDARRLLLWVFMALTVWLVEQTWQQLLFGTNLLGEARHGDGALTGPFTKPRAGQVLLAVLFPALLPAVLGRLQRRDWRAQAAGALLLAGAVASMIVIGQRMPVLLMAFGFALAGLLAPRLRWPLVGALVAAGAVLALLPVLSPPTYDKLVLTFLAQMQHFWHDPYGQIYLRAMTMLNQHPWTGAGFEGFRHHCGDARYLHGYPALGIPDAEVTAEIGCNIHPHNLWLEIATDAGWPGLILFGAACAMWLRAAAAGLSVMGQPVRAALLIALAVQLWPLAAKSSIFVVDAGGFLFLLAGWALAARPQPDR